LYNPAVAWQQAFSTAPQTEYMRLPRCVVVAAKSTKHQEGATAFSFIAKNSTNRTKDMTMKVPKPKGKCGVPVGYIGIADVQMLLNKCRTTIWNMVNDGRLPKPLRDGKLRIWDRKEMLRWIENAKFCK
jgi:predicted DNA-binding transcriptional regulator AlpA